MLKYRGGRELLGHFLADGHLNAPEARPWPPDERGERAAVRLVENYRHRDLPIRDLDEAVASELVFSAWIRRRDAHAYNRAYVRGIPMFFDHGAAFDSEYETAYFLRKGRDFGYVPAWTLTTAFRRPTTMRLREATLKTGCALHAIKDPDAVRRHMDRWTGWVLERPYKEIANAADRASMGIDTVRMLERSRRELPRMVERIACLLADDDPQLEPASA